MSTVKRLKVLKPKPAPKRQIDGFVKRTPAEVAAARKKALQREIADFAAAGRIPLKEGVCLALGGLPLRAKGSTQLPHIAAFERAYRTAHLRFIGRTEADRAAQRTSRDGDLLVSPLELFTWLKAEYLKKLPVQLETWLAEQVEHRIGLPAPSAEPSTSTLKPRSRSGHVENHLETARKLLALMVLADHGPALKGPTPDWDFLPRTLKKGKPHIAGFVPETVCDTKTMKSHIARSITLLLEGHELAEQYPAIFEMAGKKKVGLA